MIEIPLKQFVYDEAARLDIRPWTVRQRIWDGKYPKLKMRRVNKRVIYVCTPTQK